MIREHDFVVLTRAVPEARLEAGDVGVVVHVYRDGAAFEVEFTRIDGDTVAVETLPAGSIRAATGSDMPHARHRAA